ncbi:MAG: aminotransferase class I/II-fold pyridoxal phosphate-dependent enzyme [Pseudomonadota bacterium]
MAGQAIETEPQPHGLEALYEGKMPYPFQRVRDLLEGTPPGIEPEINLTLGEPREPMPDFVVEKLAETQALYAKYPPIRGTDELRNTISDWLGRRYGLTGPKRVDPETEILPTNGSREALFFASLPAVGRKAGRVARPAVLMANPYYAAYIGSAFATNAEPVYLNGTPDTSFLPDLDELAAQPELLDRAALLYICSPANPQGVLATPAYTRRALDLARKHDFMLFFDECYSEIYDQDKPVGGLEVAVETPERFKNLLVFNSLSKRSNLPGLRSGFCAGDPDFLNALAGVRNLIGPQVPLPTQAASVAIWSDEAHVEVTRAAYRKKFDICDAVLQGRYGYQRPAGGFFLWLNMAHFGGGIDATVTLWKRCGVRVLPGAFLSMTGTNGVNPGDDYIRMALVDTPEVIETALKRMVEVF